MDEEEILLKEYEVCQSDNNSKGNQSWISFSIIITVNLVLLAQVIYYLVITSSPSDGYSKLFVIIISLAMVIILLLFKQWDKRVSFHIRLNHRRMREIEEFIKAKKGDWLLQKKWSERSLDIHYDPKENEKIPDDFKPILDKIFQYYPNDKKPKDASYQTKYISSVSKGRWNFHNIYWILIALWVLTTVVKIFI